MIKGELICYNGRFEKIENIIEFAKESLVKMLV